MVYIFSRNEKTLKKVFPPNAEFTDSPISKHSPSNKDVSYFDVSGLSAEEIKKTLNQIKKSCGAAPWGIIDPKGSVKDTAALFFEGACDYLGPALMIESGVDAKRLKEVLAWRKHQPSTEGGDKSASADGKGGFIKSGIKLPAASAFPGWNKMQVGKSMPFYLLYCALQGKVALDSRLDDKTVAQIHKNFLTHLDENLQDSDGLLWMNTGKDCLFLIPPRAKCVEEAIKACVRMVISAPQIVLETLDLSIPSNIVFALHYGTLSYKQPGKTGTVVSDAVNFIFHLGAKKSQPGRLTISGDLPDVTVPQNLQDLFIPAGEYEGRKIWQTKRFSYVKPWM